MNATTRLHNNHRTKTCKPILCFLRVPPRTGLYFW